MNASYHQLIHLPICMFSMIAFHQVDELYIYKSNFQEIVGNGVKYETEVRRIGKIFQIKGYYSRGHKNATS